MSAGFLPELARFAPSLPLPMRGLRSAFARPGAVVSAPVRVRGMLGIAARAPREFFDWVGPAGDPVLIGWPEGRPGRGLSLRAAVNAFCKGCIYDSLAPGAWRQQVEACSCSDCELYAVRPRSYAAAKVNGSAK